jgi:ubiquinone biosynthesis protein UbiJ
LLQDSLVLRGSTRDLWTVQEISITYFNDERSDCTVGIFSSMLLWLPFATLKTQAEYKCRHELAGELHVYTVLSKMRLVGRCYYSTQIEYQAEEFVMEFLITVINCY